MSTNAQEERKKKADEKAARINFSWVMKRLCWETVMPEKDIYNHFGNQITDLVKNGENNEAICKKMKVLINQSIGQKEEA